MNVRTSLAALATLVGASWVHAATYAYVAEPTSTLLNVGETSTVAIYLTETFADLSESTIGNNGGLAYLSVLVQFESSTASTPVQVLSNLDVTFEGAPNGFDSGLSGAVLLGDDLKIDGLVDPGGASGVLGTVAANVRTIKIAEVTFTAGTEGVTTYSLIDPPSTDDTSTWDLDNLVYLDAEFPSPGPTFSFTVIPEPAMLGAFGVLAAIGCRRRFA
jgi:hypothetical protein